MASQTKEKTALTKVKDYLNKMNIPFTPQQQESLLIAWKIKGIEFPASITATPDYLYIYSVIVLRKELKNQNLKTIYEHLLRANHLLPEVTFDLDDFGNIGTGQEIPLNGLSFEVFKSELDAIPAAILYFLETIMPETGIKLQIQTR